MKNLGQMLKQAQQLQSRMADMQARLAEAEVSGASGGGMVRVTLTGKGEMKKIAIDKSLIDPEDPEMLEDLIVAAHADAKSKLETFMQDEMAKMTGGIDLPPGFKLPF